MSIYLVTMIPLIALLKDGSCVFRRALMLRLGVKGALAQYNSEI